MMTMDRTTLMGLPHPTRKTGAGGPGRGCGCGCWWVCLWVWVWVCFFCVHACCKEPANFKVVSSKTLCTDFCALTFVKEKKEKDKLRFVDAGERCALHSVR
eukprot:137853-Pelagomonas_calceolata.AAC.2